MAPLRLEPVKGIKEIQGGDANIRWKCALGIEEGLPSMTAKRAHGVMGDWILSRSA